jgi:hypothetical protein
MVALTKKIASPIGTGEIEMGETVETLNIRVGIAESEVEGEKAVTRYNTAGSKIGTAYIRNTPNCEAGIGALSVAENASIRTRRVSAGVMMPSSHRRAVA